MRQDAASSSGVSFLLQNSEAEQAVGPHGPEQVGWIAWSTGPGQSAAGSVVAGSTGKSYKSKWKAVSFPAGHFAPNDEIALLAGCGSLHDGDVVSIRHRDLSAESFRIKLEEEKSFDSERSHPKEEINYIALLEGPVRFEPTSADADADGLPDLWQQQMGLVAGPQSGLSAQEIRFSGDPDGDGYSNGREYLEMGSDPLRAFGFPGLVDWDQWKSVEGFSVESLVYAPAYLEVPDDSAYLSVSDAPRKIRNGYGSRMRGCVIAPASGLYRFWIAGDDGVELWLSSDAKKYQKRKIAEVSPATGADTGGTGYLEWDKYLSQRSGWISMEAGEEYYFELLHIDHHVDDHLSLGWQIGGTAPIELIGGEHLRSWEPDPNDNDDDSLPDDWEENHGLNSDDNGADDSRHGERGDYDGDGLTNHEEYLLGSDPSTPDSGDDPLELAEGDYELETNLDLASYAAASGTWLSLADGSLLSEERRGWIEYAFSTNEPGFRIFEIEAQAEGEVGGPVSMGAHVEIDATPLGRYELRSSPSSAGTVRGLTPWLAAGEHTLRVFFDNVVGGRMIRIQSVHILNPMGEDLDGDGIADWLGGAISVANGITQLPVTSPVSPAFIEGIARYTSGMEIEASGAPVVLHDGINGGWYADLPLEADGGATPVVVSFENGALTESHDVTWQMTDVLATFSLKIRAGDSLLLGAKSPTGADNLADQSVISVDGAAVGTVLGSSFGLKYQFNEAGTYMVSADYAGVAGEILSGTMNVEVVEADFGESFYAIAGLTYNWVVSDVPVVLPIEKDADLLVEEAGVTGNGSRKLEVGTAVPGARHLLARVGASSSNAVVDRGTIEGTWIATASETGDINTEAIPGESGSHIVRASIVADNLPPDGRVKVKIKTSGITFLDGTVVKVLTAEDFGDSGVAYLEFNYPEGARTSFCHRMYVYDGNNVLLGSF